MKYLRLTLPMLCGLMLSGCSETKSEIKSAVSPAKTGWWIKVRKEKQESPTITFFIGLNKETSEPWKTWNRGESLEFDLPAKFHNVERLYVKAQSSGKLNSWFCTMYGTNGVKRFAFNDDEDHEQQQSDRTDDCIFTNP